MSILTALPHSLSFLLSERPHSGLLWPWLLSWNSGPAVPLLWVGAAKREMAGSCLALHPHLHPTGWRRCAAIGGMSQESAF